MLALMPHGSCFFWNVPLTALHVSSDLIIAIAYFSIPAMIFLNRHQASVGARPMLLLFATFILCCGLGHAIQAWNIWHSNYWLEGFEKLSTAIVSGYTAIFLQVQIPTFLGTQKALEESEELIKTDPLTGLANRRGLEAAIAAALTSNSLGRQAQTLMLLDLDDFKDVNDTYGHPIGDELLQKVGQVIQNSTRTIDTVARLGGDEFAVLLTGCSLTEAIAVADKLRIAVSGLYLQPNLQQLKLSDKLSVSISIGLTPIRDGIDAEGLYKLADEALYDAKRLGKNQICWTDSVSQLPCPSS